MLINRDELAKKVLGGEITCLEDLNGTLRSMIKDVVETAMGAEMTDFLGYDRYQTPGSEAMDDASEELAGDHGPAFDFLSGKAQRLSLLDTQPGGFVQFLEHFLHRLGLTFFMPTYP